MDGCAWIDRAAEQAGNRIITGRRRKKEGRGRTACQEKVTKHGRVTKTDLAETTMAFLRKTDAS